MKGQTDTPETDSPGLVCGSDIAGIFTATNVDILQTRPAPAAFKVLTRLRVQGVDQGTSGPWAVNRVEPCELTLEPWPGSQGRRTFSGAGAIADWTTTRVAAPDWKRPTPSRSRSSSGGTFSSGFLAGTVRTLTYSKPAPAIMATGRSRSRRLPRRLASVSRPMRLQFSLAHPAVAAGDSVPSRPGADCRDVAAFV